MEISVVPAFQILSEITDFYKTHASAAKVTAEDELVVADLNLNEIQEVRQVWQFFRDRRPETYGDLVKT